MKEPTNLLSLLIHRVDRRISKTPDNFILIEQCMHIITKRNAHRAYRSYHMTVFQFMVVKVASRSPTIDDAELFSKYRTK